MPRKPVSSPVWEHYRFPAEVARWSVRPGSWKQASPPPPATLPPAGFQGWAETWQEIPLKGFFPGDSASAGYWQSLMESLATQFPALARSRDVHFHGTFQDARRAKMGVTLQTDTPGAASLAAKLGDWLTGRKISGHVQVGASGGSIEVANLELYFAED